MATDDQMEHAALRRKAVVTAIRESIERRGYPPTLSELATAMDVDRETIKVDVRMLERGGYLEVDKGVTRGMRIAGLDVVLVPRTPVGV
jgi:SOS-response transcriptional repressor LexA